MSAVQQARRGARRSDGAANTAATVGVAGSSPPPMATSTQRGGLGASLEQHLDASLIMQGAGRYGKAHVAPLLGDGSIVRPKPLHGHPPIHPRAPLGPRPTRAEWDVPRVPQPKPCPCFGHRIDASLCTSSRHSGTAPTPRSPTGWTVCVRRFCCSMAYIDFPLWCLEFPRVVVDD
jgi:hypothetical protein